MDSVGNSSVHPGLHSCVSNIKSRYIFTAWFTVYLLFLPVFLFVLYIGFNKWKKPQSSAPGGLSHSDVFTLNMVAMEMACVMGSCVICWGYFSKNKAVLVAKAEGVFTITYAGQVLFHSLTCVERYLAVVHPVIYLRLKREGGVTIRNISISLIWVFSVVFGCIFSHHHNSVLYGTVGLVVSSASMPLVTYCSVFVLCVLTRPKPGEGGSDRKEIDQSKRTIVYTMVAIVGALLLRLIYHVVNGCINFWFWNEGEGCVVITSTLWVALPSSLVLPLLFLHRAGKLPGKARK